jgi:Domain of unknown function (DUF2828)
MSAMISALDSLPFRMGENGHVELDWSSDIQEKIVQFDFQCVRTDSAGVSNLVSILDDILLQLTTHNYTTDSDKAKRNSYLTTLFKVIGKTRDINGGKGEYTLAYMMIWVWYKHFPSLAETALQLFVVDPKVVNVENDSQEPYGSWKDIKYFCKYVMDNGGDMSHPLIQFCIEGINFNLRQDDQNYNMDTDGSKNISLVSKWIPREESGKFGFLYETLAVNYFPEFIVTAKTDVSRGKAVKKCKTQYRMLCSKLNRHLDTVQIKQTAKNWAEINHAKTTSITMAKQRKAFLNQKKDNGAEQRSDDPDRVACADNLRAYLESLKKEGKEVKGKHVGLNDFAEQAYNLLCYNNNNGKQVEIDIINSQWRDNCNKKNANGLGPMVAIVDTSGSMSGDPINAAVALGCRVAEKSILGKRVMTFSSDPTWINLEGCDTFTSMVDSIRKNDRYAGYNTDFYKALDMILTAIEANKVPPVDVENMVLAIFSDMQIDDNLNVMINGGSNYICDESHKKANHSKWDTMFQQIKKKYADVGMRLYGQPLNPPHILFWNLRKTNGFPTLSTEAGCSMMSGFDPTILNMFCELGMEALREMTPYKTLLKTLDNVRYLPMERVITVYLNSM